jgi:hypothetical protein
MINSSVFNTAPVLVSLAAFGTYAALGHPLTAAVAFPSLALFNLLRFPIVMIPQQIFNLIAARVVSVLLLLLLLLSVVVVIAQSGCCIAVCGCQLDHVSGGRGKCG